MTSIERTIAEVFAFLLLLGSGALYERHAGATKCETGDKIAAAKQEGANQAIVTEDKQDITKAGDTYAHAISVDPMPTPDVRLCRYATAAAVPQATAAGSGAHGADQLSAADFRPAEPGILLGPPVNQPLAKVGQAADAEVAYLQDYVAKVCLRPAAP